MPLINCKTKTSNISLNQTLLEFSSDYWFSLFKPKDIIRNNNVIINGKNLCDHLTDFHIKLHEKIQKRTTGKGEDYTKAWLLDYDYIKNQDKPKAVDLSR